MNRDPRRQVFVAGVGVALGIGKPIPFEAGRTFGACAFDSRRYRQEILERFGMWKADPV
jgi:hypothetical protein